MKKVYTAKDPVDAHLLKGALEGENIQSTVHGEFLWSTRGEVPITTDTCPSVWVTDDADYERAMKLVRDFQSQEMITDIESEEWKCDNCNEMNGGQFSECWQCGAERNQGQQG